MRTGSHTGRSPQDKFVVDEPGQPRQRLVGSRQPAHQRGALRGAARARPGPPRQARDVRPGPLRGGPSRPPAVGPRDDRIGLGQPLRPQPVHPAVGRGERAAFRADFTIYDAPTLTAEPERDGTRTGTFILVHLTRREVLIGGTAYAGEIKKSAFTVMNYLLPDEHVLPMHSAVNVGPAGDTAVFFGLSGTGKTTLVGRPGADADRRRRARLGPRWRLQLRGRLLRQDDPPVADLRARHLLHDPPLRHDPGERGHGRRDAPAGPGLGGPDREHPRRLPRLASSPTPPRSAAPATPRRSSS